MTLYHVTSVHWTEVIVFNSSGYFVFVTARRPYCCLKKFGIVELCLRREEVFSLFYANCMVVLWLV